MMQSVSDLCSALQDVTPTEDLGGLGLRAQILRVFLHDALAEHWEPKEMKAVGPGMVALLKAGIIDRASVREAFEGSLMGWYEDTKVDTPLLPGLIRTMIEPLVLQRVLLASELPDEVVDACVPKVARLAKEELTKQQGGGGVAPPAAAGSSAGIPGGPGLSTYRAEQASGLSSGGVVTTSRPKASVGSVFSFLQEAAAERQEPPKAAAAPAESSSSASTHSAKPSTEAAAPAAAAAATASDADADAALEDLYATAGKKKKSKKGKKGADFQLEGEAEAPAAAAVAAVAPPVVPQVEADPNAAEVLQDLYASAGKKKKLKKAKKAPE